MDGWVGQGMQHAALYNIIQDYIAARCEKLSQGFYTVATWRGVEPRTCDTLVRRSASGRGQKVKEEEKKKKIY